MPGRLIWITGHHTSGKTWLGDYLAQYHGFQHVDGDEIQHLYEAQTDQGDPSLKAPSEGLMSHFADYLMLGKGAGPGELWQPYYNLVMAKAQAIRKADAHADIVIVLVAFAREVRDFIRAFFDEPVVFIALTVAVEDYAKDQISRVKRYLKSNQQSEEEAWKELTSQKPAFCDVPFEGDQSWLKYFSESDGAKGLACFDESDDLAAVIQTKYRTTVPKAVEETLGLTPFVGSVGAGAISLMSCRRLQMYAGERKRLQKLRVDVAVVEATCPAFCGA